jgi:hypothetical protein
MASRRAETPPNDAHETQEIHRSGGPSHSTRPHAGTVAGPSPRSHAPLVRQRRSEALAPHVRMGTHRRHLAEPIETEPLSGHRHEMSAPEVPEVAAHRDGFGEERSRTRDADQFEHLRHIVCHEAPDLDRVPCLKIERIENQLVSRSPRFRQPPRGQRGRNASTEQNAQPGYTDEHPQVIPRILIKRLHRSEWGHFRSISSGAAVDLAEMAVFRLERPPHGVFKRMLGSFHSTTTRGHHVRPWSLCPRWPPTSRGHLYAIPRRFQRER